MARDSAANEALRGELHRRQEARGERANERKPEPRGEPGSPINEALRGDMAGKRRETLRRVLTKTGHHDDVALMDAEEEAREARRLADEAKARLGGR
jgi:hypothetical protein